jgi:hypothetical protein
MASSGTAVWLASCRVTRVVGRVLMLVALIGSALVAWSLTQPGPTRAASPGE